MSKGKALAGSLIPILMVGLLVFYGCSKDTSINSPVVTGTDDPLDMINIVQVEEGSHSASWGSFSAKEHIVAADGGTVNLTYTWYGYMDGDHTVDVPAGALPGDTTVSITVPYPWMMVVDMGTAGLNFSRSVDIDLHYESPYIGSLSPTSNYYIAYWNPATSKWEEIPGTVTYGNGWIDAEFSVDHFSRYAVAER
jgi:hypothetical protein